MFWLKKLLLSHVNNVALEVFNFDKLNFSKTTVWHKANVKQIDIKLLSKKTGRKTFFLSENPKTIYKTFLGFFHHSHPRIQWMLIFANVICCSRLLSERDFTQSVRGLGPNHTKADCSHEASEYRCSMDIKVSEATYNCKIGFT